ncbi:MAG: iron(III) transport system permease protein [Trebonia sp.]|jgi:iron(III) transport system permease protein|nr:iron(III) transport system permease protein [Trebonia sp.]
MTISASLAPGRGTRIRRLLPETGLQASISGLVLVAVLAPVVPLVYASVQSAPIYQPGRYFTLAAYRQLFTDPAFWAAARNTAEFAAITTAGALVLGGGFAIVCCRTDVPGRRWYQGLLIAPLVLPPLGLILGWNALYGPGGYAHDFITQTLHLPFNLSTVPGMAVLGTAVAVPVVFLVCQAALSGMDSSLEDAARSVGAPALRVLGRVTLPMLRPALVNAGLLVFTLSIESLGVPLVFGSPQGHDFIASYLYIQWSSAFTPGPPVVSAGATVLLGCACALLLLRGRLLRDQPRFVTIGGRRGATGSVRLPAAARLVLSVLLGLYVAVTTFAPIAALGLASVTTELTPLIAPWHLFTAGNWRAIGQGEFASSIRNTVEIALAGAVITTAVVALATAVAHRSTFPFRRGLPFLLLFPRAIPGLIIGIGFFWTFLLVNPPGHALLGSLWGIMLALSVRSLTIAYFVLSAAFAAVSESLDDAARSAGASWWTAITRITLPILRPALFAAFILMFISILNDYDPALFLVTPGHELMGVTMLLSEQKGVNGPVASLAMVQVAITVVAIAVAGRLFATRTRGRRNA